MHVRLALLVVAGFAVLTVGCGDPATTGARTSTVVATRVVASLPPATSATAWGIAGVTPAGFPQTSADAWRAYYESLGGLGGWQGAFGAWTREQGLPSVVRTQPAVGAQYGFRSIPLVGFHRDAGPGRVALTVDFADDAAAEAYTQAIVALARDQRPAFLGIGNEVNRIADQDPAAYAAWARRVPSIVSAVHEASPQTRVFATYQLEMLLGRAGLSGRPPRVPQWALLDGVAAAVDVVAFTTYPFFDFASSEELPAGYYRDAASEANRHGAHAVGFSEVGWPGAVTPPLRGDPRDGSPEEQVAFIRRLPALLEGVNPAFVLWAFDHDPGINGTPFDRVGLAENGGAARPGLEAWRTVVKGVPAGSP